MAGIGFFTGQITWLDTDEDSPVCDCRKCRQFKRQKRAQQDALKRYLARYFSTRKQP